MNKVYITNASTTLILEGFKKLNIKLSREELILDIQSDFLEENFFSDEGFNDFFNTDELNTIYMMKRILKNLSNLIKDMNDNKGLINNYISSQNNRFAQRVKAPAYHQVSECQYLKSNFSNIEFPKNINEDIKDKIRLFIKGYDNKNFDEVNKLIKEKFNIKEDFKKIDLANSGIKNIDNVEIKTNLFQQISKEFEDMYNLLYSGEEKAINKAVKNILYAYIKLFGVISYEC